MAGFRKFDFTTGAARLALRDGLKRFRKGEEGSLIIFGLFLFVMMLMIGGLAVDLMRYEAQRSRLQSTLDRAVLAAASLDQPLDPAAVVADYFDKAGLSNYLQSVTVEDLASSRRVTAQANMVVDATLLKLLGINTLNAPAVGAAEESASQTEISLVVDVSGSMSRGSASGNSKVYELRRAAKQFVNIMQCDPGNPNATTGCTVAPGKVSISLVPYSEQVLAGETLLSQFNTTGEHNFSSCVTFSETQLQTTALDPTVLLQRTGHFDPWSSSRSSARSWTCRTDAWREIRALEFDPAVLRTRIDALGASGNTSIDVGMKWGAALLDPSTRPVVSSLIAANQVSSAFQGRPFDVNANGIEKVIVLMTDGVNTSQHFLHDGYRTGPSAVFYNASQDRYSVYHAATGQYYWDFNGGSWQDHAYGGGQYLSCSRWGSCTWVTEPGTSVELTFPEVWAKKPWRWWKRFSWLGSPGTSVGNTAKNARLQTMCDAAKANNIAIFTIGFEVTSDSATVMRNCASSPAHYFDANGLNLTDAFAAIARQISKLRLVN